MSAKPGTAKKRDFDYKLIKHIRLSRGYTQENFSRLCGLNRVVLVQLERGQLTFSDYYYSKIKNGLRRIRYSQYELDAQKRLHEYRTARNYSE